MDVDGKRGFDPRNWLPSGKALPEGSWRSRHRALYSLLVLHIPAIFAYGLATGNSVAHSGFEAGIVALFAIGGGLRTTTRRARAAMTTIGLVASSAVLVHLSGGLIEMHFHFFIMVALITLYQDWIPFLLAIGFVVLHHGSMGAIDVSSVYNHPDAIDHPWKWAMIHGLFIVGQCVACLAGWKVNEIGMERERAARIKFEEANRDLAEAQAMSNLGSWEWNLLTGRVEWSEQLFRIVDKDPEHFIPSVEGFLALLHEGDRKRVEGILERANALGTDFHYEARIVTESGAVKIAEAGGRPFLDEQGTVVRMAGTLQDVSARRTLEEQIEYQAFHDSLTGLANRALFLDRVEHALVRSERQTALLAVLFVDLDDFKAVNDSLGHRAGDELLIAVSRRIQTVLRSIDTIARLGGDEFAILLEDVVDEHEVVAITRRILASLRSPFEIEGNVLYVRASIGVALSSDELPRTPDDLLRNADTAMYVTKHEGKDGLSLFEQQMHDTVSKRLSLKVDLQRAITNEEFVVHYQPIVDLDSGEVSGLEALVRWDKPGRGMVPPMDFIPYAEETALILPITRFVLREACAQAARWQTFRPLRMSVNISAVSFRDDDFVEDVASILGETGLPPERLTLEITESVLVQDPAVVNLRLAELKDLGIRLAIDDFGTGYSSLAYLKDLPIDIIKIDKSFVDSIAMNPEESALARAIIKLGRTLGLDVVAEGVENADQATVLSTLSCPFAQGYLFSRPNDLPTTTELLQASRSLAQESAAARP